MNARVAFWLNEEFWLIQINKKCHSFWQNTFSFTVLMCSSATSAITVTYFWWYRTEAWAISYQYEWYFHFRRSVRMCVLACASVCFPWRRNSSHGSSTISQSILLPVRHSYLSIWTHYEESTGTLVTLPKLQFETKTVHRYRFRDDCDAPVWHLPGLSFIAVFVGTLFPSPSVLLRISVL